MRGRVIVQIVWSNDFRKTLYKSDFPKGARMKENQSSWFPARSDTNQEKLEISVI